MTVFENIAFGLSVLPRRERPNKAAIDKKVTQLLEMIQLPSFSTALSCTTFRRAKTARSFSESIGCRAANFITR